MAFTLAKSFTFEGLTDNFQKLSTNITSTVQDSLKDIGDNLQPLTQNAIQVVKDRISLNPEDESKLPEEYILLEQKVDTLRIVYRKFLDVTQTYEIESYDYPPNIKESITDISKTFQEKFHELSAANTTKEAETILTKPSSNQFPKTMAYAIAKAALVSRESLLEQTKHEQEEDDEDDSFAKVLLEFADAQKAVGKKRLEQDSLIINEFNLKIKNTLDKNFKETLFNRKKVEESKSNLDHINRSIKIAKEQIESLEKNPDHEDEEKIKVQLDKLENYAKELEAKVEPAEDDLISKTGIAVTSMKNFLSPVDSINLIKIFTTIQLNYFKSAAAELEKLLSGINEISASLEEEEDDEDDDDDDE